MDGAPTAPSAARDGATVRWVRRSVLRSVGVLAVSSAAAAWGWAVGVLRVGSPAGVLGATLGGVATLAVLWSGWSLVVWRWRWRAMRAAPWRLGAVTVTSTVSRAGHRRVDAEVAYLGGVQVRYRLGDSTPWWTSDALARSVEVWVASGPGGTVIATPGPGRCALAGPGSPSGEPGCVPNSRAGARSAL